METRPQLLAVRPVHSVHPWAWASHTYRWARKLTGDSVRAVMCNQPPPGALQFVLVKCYTCTWRKAGAHSAWFTVTAEHWAHSTIGYCLGSF